eukprot:scaffold70405_cov69-Phaeocystis_antarctica.AAC.2
MPCARLHAQQPRPHGDADLLLAHRGTQLDVHLHLGVVLCPGVWHQRHERLRRVRVDLTLFARRHARITAGGLRLRRLRPTPLDLALLEVARAPQLQRHLVEVRLRLRLRVRVRVRGRVRVKVRAGLGCSGTSGAECGDTSCSACSTPWRVRCARAPAQGPWSGSVVRASGQGKGSGLRSGSGSGLRVRTRRYRRGSSSCTGRTLRPRRMPRSDGTAAPYARSHNKAPRGRTCHSLHGCRATGSPPPPPHPRHPPPPPPSPPPRAAACRRAAGRRRTPPASTAGSGRDCATRAGCPRVRRSIAQVPGPRPHAARRRRARARQCIPDRSALRCLVDQRWQRGAPSRRDAPCAARGRADRRGWRSLACAADRRRRRDGAVAAPSQAAWRRERRAERGAAA